MNLKLNVSKEAWRRWKDVIHHLSKPPYDFPASNQDEFSLFLRMFSGTGTTFRISRDRWKFVIDVLRIGNDIIDIVAVTVIAHTIQDERHNGFVITKACRAHLNKDTKSPGSPELKWHMVTSGGEAYHHCCDKECIGPDRVNKRKLNWESTRLNIIQKAFEQEVLELRRENMFFAADMRKLEQKNSKKASCTQDQKLRTQIQEQLRQLAESADAVERHRNNYRITAEENARLRENGRIMAEEIVDLRGQLKATGKQRDLPNQHMTRQQKLQERFDEISRENMRLKMEVHQLMQSSEVLKASNLQLSSYNAEIRARADEKKQNHEELEAARTQLKDRTKRLGKQIRHNQDRVTGLKDASKKLKTAKAQLKVDLRNADDHNRLLESEVYYSRINEHKSAEKHVEHITVLEDKIKLKDALIQQLQQNILRHQSQAPNQVSTPSREELERQRIISREAHERASDLESKLDAMKAAMTDKADEMTNLEKEWSAKVAEADSMKRRYHDKDAYITNLETKLEELRGTMENVLGQVSMHQGRKRRRTEGPDFQL